MEQDPNSYQFMNETIKTIPPDRKKIVKRVILFLAGSVVFGMIAALVFAVTEPKLSALFYPETPVQVTIPEDEDPNLTEDSEGMEAASSEEAESREQETKPEETKVEEPEPQTTVTEQVTLVQEMTPVDYQKLQNQMVQTAQRAEKSLVRVIGIQNQMDYLNHSFENQSEIGGLIIADNGSELFILTEYRVVEQVERIQVILWDSTIVDAIFQKQDPNTGLAVLKVDKQLLDPAITEKLEPVQLGNSYNVYQGSIIMAVGNPNGYNDAIVFGHITSTANRVSLYDCAYSLLITDILGTNDGSGVILNINGEVIGVIQQKFSPNGQNAVTAIGISQIKNLIQDLSNNITHPFLGIQGQDVTSEISKQTGVPIGVLVSSLAENSPALMAGIKEADIIVRIGDEKISNMKEYSKILGKLKEDDSVAIAAMRKGAEGYVEVTFDSVVVGTMPEHE